MTAVGLSCAHDESSQPRGSTVGKVMVTLQQVRPPHFSELGEDFSASDSGLSTDSTAEPCMTNEYSLCDVTSCIPVHSGIVQNQIQQIFSVRET